MDAVVGSRSSCRWPRRSPSKGRGGEKRVVLSTTYEICWSSSSRHGHRGSSNGRSSCDCFLHADFHEDRNGTVPLYLCGFSACTPDCSTKTACGYLVSRMAQELSKEARDEAKVWLTCGKWNPRETRMAFVPKWIFRGCISRADPKCLVRRGHASVVYFCLWVSQQWLDLCAWIWGRSLFGYRLMHWQLRSPSDQSWLRSQRQAIGFFARVEGLLA